MANYEVSDVLKCIHILLMRKELVDNQQSQASSADVDEQCPQSSECIKCSCHASRNANLNSVIKKNIDSFVAHIENSNMTEFMEHQGTALLLTDCLCYGCNNNIFQPNGCNCDTVWDFVVTCLKTILALVQIVDGSEVELLKRRQNNETHVPNIIGVKDQESICSLIELIISLGVLPNLMSGIGRPIKHRNDFQTMLPKSNNRPRKILIIINVLLVTMKCKALHSMILSRNISDIIASLVQLRHGPNKGDNTKVTLQCCCVGERDFKGCVNCSRLCKHEMKWCDVELNDILEHSYQPLIIKELLILQQCSIMHQQSGNKWFLKVIGHKLSKCMMRENGVKYVIEGILAGCNADSMNWQRYQSIGKLIARVPRQVANANDYYELVAPQLLKIMAVKESSSSSKIATSSHRSQYVMVAVSCIQEMLKLNYDLTEEYIFNSLFSALLSSFEQEGYIKVDSPDISRCIMCLHLMCSVEVDLGGAFIKMLSKVMHPLFIIFCLHPHDNIRSLLNALLVYLLHHIEPSNCIVWLNIFIFGKLPSLSSADLELVNMMNAVHISAKFVTKPSNSIDLEEKETITAEDVSTDEKISAVLLLLKHKNLENIRGEFFVELLKQLSSSLQCDNDKPNECEAVENSQELKEIDEKISNLQYRIQLVSIISALTDTFEYTILQNTPQIVEFLKGILDLPWEKTGGISLENVSGFHEQTVDLTLMLISFLLKTDKLTSSDFVILNTLVPSLDKASVNHSQESSRSLANDLRVYIATRGAAGAQETKPSRPPQRKVDLSSKEAYENALQELNDPLLPTRGHALFQLSKLLKYRNKYAIKEQKKLLDIFELNLAHQDSYLYLAAIEGLLFLVDVHHKDIFPLLCRKFAQFRDGEKEQKFSSELRLKIGEAIVKSCRLCGDMLPYYAQLLLSALMTGVKDEDFLVRASSLSAIGEVCQLSKFSIGSIITEVVSCIHCVVLTDKSVEVRRAAMQVFALLFKGIGTRILQQVPSAVRDIHHLLKNVVATDGDELTKLHASNALDILDVIVKDTLFPKPVLEKKIQITM